MVPYPSITLTDDEYRECQESLSSVAAPGAWYTSEELLEPFKNNVVALCMTKRARRFALEGRSAEACEAAAKACCAYPMYAHCYDFARILESVGKTTEAKAVFEEFLRLHDAGPQNDIDRNFDRVNRLHRDVPMMAREARTKLGIPSAPNLQAGLWDSVLSRCDLIMARDRIAEFYRLADWGAFDSEDIRQSIEKGEGAYYYAPKYIETWHAFRDYPNIETAKALLDILPSSLPYFENCCPGGLTYSIKRGFRGEDI
jgi:hypothetical protein